MAAATERALVIPASDSDDRKSAIERAQAGELLSGPELAAIFRIGHTQFHKLAKLGHFRAFEVTPAIGQKRYSGIKVYRYLCGDPVYEPVFAGKRRRR